jgi:hypothetical protein
MSRNLQRTTALLILLALFLITIFGSSSPVKAARSWTGDPDPYACGTFGNCYWTLNVCINQTTHLVGISTDPDQKTDAQLMEIALNWSNTELTVGKCPTYRTTGRWIHTYTGKTWTCNLVSEAGENKHAPRFSNPEYVKQACGEHELFGPFEGGAEYTLCREKFADGVYYCGNHYDTSY